MATLVEIRNKANARLATLWPILQAREAAYFLKHGRYFGLRWSPSVVVDGIDAKIILNRPSRAHEAADVDFTGDTPFSFQIFRLNQDTPEETYQVFVRVTLLNGDTYERTRTRDNIDSGWYLIIQ